MEVLLLVPSLSRSKCWGRQVLYKLLSHRLNGGQNHDIKVGNKFYESVAKLKYFGTTLKRIKTVFMKKLHADWTWGKPATVWSRILCLPNCFPKIWRI